MSDPWEDFDREPPIDDADAHAAEANADTKRQLAFNRAVQTEVQRLRVRQHAQDIIRREREPTGEVFDAGSLAEIMARPAPPRMRMEGLIPSDAGILAVSMRKTGKTTLELNYARSLTTGEDFLGRFPVRQVSGNVAILNYEVSGHTLAAWADEHRIDGDRLFLVNLRGCANPLSNPRARVELAQWLRIRSIEALIVDPFGRAFNGTSQNDPGEVGAWLIDLDLFARTEVGATDILLTAHAGWNGERARGSTALEDWADAIIWMTRDKDDETKRFLRAEGRDVLVDEDELSYDPSTRTLALTGHGSRRHTKTYEKTTELAQFVRLAAGKVPGASTADLIRIIRKMPAAPNFQDRDVSQAARWAEAQGLVRIVDNGPGKAKNHYATPTPSNPVQTPSKDAPQHPVQPRLYRDGVGVDGVPEADPVQLDTVATRTACSQSLDPSL